MYRLTGILSVAALLSLVCVDARAGDPLRATASGSAVSQSSLAAMGLGGMQTLTRAESSKIQGQGAVVWGSSTANWNGYFGNSTSTNSYVAAGSHFAFGKNASAAGNNFNWGVWASGSSSAGSF